MFAGVKGGGGGRGRGGAVIGGGSRGGVGRGHAGGRIFVGEKEEMEHVRRRTTVAPLHISLYVSIHFVILTILNS